MRMRMKWLAALLAAMAVATASRAAPAPHEWIDATTGHRVVRVAYGPGTSLLYFTQEIFTPQGDKMVITTADGIAAVDLGSWVISPIVSIRHVTMPQRNSNQTENSVISWPKRLPCA